MMKLKKWLLSTFFAGALAAGVGAQCPNPVNSLVISTGFDPIANSVIIPPTNGSTPDPMWRLVQSPTPPPPWNVNIGGPAWVIERVNGWDAAWSTSQYINAFNTNASVLNNWFSGDPYIFEREFCLCSPDGPGVAMNVVFDLHLHADNWAEVELTDDVGNPIATLLSENFLYTTDAFQDPTDDANVTQSLIPGTYRLRIYLRNQLQSMGVSLDGTISSTGVLSDEDCGQDGSIIGIKFNDCDQSGSITPLDRVVQGVTINLLDNSGTVVGTSITDQNGLYFFNDVPIGTYRLQEVLTSGGTAVAPAGGVYNSVNVMAATVTLLDFLNYNPDECGSTGISCDGSVLFTTEIKDCGGQFLADLSNLPAGANVISTSWTFGDQGASTELNPFHYYDVPGTYNVCLQVVTFDGEECCTYRFCQAVDISKACNDGCDFEVDILSVKDEINCTFDFTASVVYAGTPITLWYWDFGDGTTATGSTVQGHQFPQQGTYDVCVTVFGLNGDLCCSQTFCSQQKVNCNAYEPPPGERRHVAHEESNTISFFPNPSEGDFQLQLKLIEAAPVDLKIVDLKGAVLYQKDLGEVAKGTINFPVDANLPAGVYIATVTLGDAQMNRRLVIQ